MNTPFLRVKYQAKKTPNSHANSLSDAIRHCLYLKKNCALSHLSVCTHNPDHSLYNYFSGSVQCTPQSTSRKAILIVTCQQSRVHLVIFDLTCQADRIIHVRNSVPRSIFQLKFKSEIANTEYGYRNPAYTVKNLFFSDFELCILRFSLCLAQWFSWTKGGKSNFLSKKSSVR